jgi:hypothetical protein
MIKCFPTLLTIAAILLYSCHTPRYVYSPSPPNNPYFEKKGDTKLSGFYSGTGRSDQSKQINEGYDLQGAYALSDNWAITASFFKRKEKDTYFLYENSRYNIFDSSVVDYKRHLIELGGGYFTPLNRSKNVFLNFYSGVGLGKFSFMDNGVDTGSSYSRFHKSNIFKVYGQAGLNVITGDYFRFSLSGRISLVHYAGISTSYLDNELKNFHLNKINDGWLGFIEPSINMQFGMPQCKWVKIEMGMTLSSDPESNYLEARSFCPYIGLSFDFSKVKR